MGYCCQDLAPAHSRQNLIHWLDTLIYGFSATSLMYDIDGNREHALVHHIKGPNFDRDTAALSSLNLWGAPCTRAGRSCGKFYIIRHGGEGTINMQHTRYGPSI